MKSFEHYLQGLYCAILSQIAEDIPELARDCLRDSSRLCSLVESRGLPYLMIELPAAGKHFDKCLSAERLTPLEIPGFARYRKRGGPIPRLFKGLFLRVFDEAGMLRSDFDIASIRLLRQLFYMAKKVKISCGDSATWEQVEEFFKDDREVVKGSLDWDDDDLGESRAANLTLCDDYWFDPLPFLPLDDSSHRDREGPVATLGWELCDSIQRTADAISSQLGVFNPEDWRPRHGPGVVSDQKASDFKYDFPNWPDKLEATFPYSLFAFHCEEEWARVASEDWRYSRLATALEPPSRLIAVPKTLKGPRLIASEPVSHQWCQQVIRDFLTSRCRISVLGSCVDFSSQVHNQKAALAASHDGSKSTIDLSAASDRLSCWLVERVFRRIPSVLRAIHASRTRWIVNTIDKKSPKYHILRKLSCMGSAITFPVQSIVFSVLAIGTIIHEKYDGKITYQNLQEAARMVRVFGDDIIVPTDVSDTFVQTLSAFGLKVNPDKTFIGGAFKESCGVDAYSGCNVTPVYVNAPASVSRPESVISSVAVHNNLLSAGYHKAATYVKRTVQSLKRFSFGLVPVGSDAFGWYAFEGKGSSGYYSRWNHHLHRAEYHLDTLVAKGRVEPIQRGSALLQYFTEALNPPLSKEERIGKRQRPALTIRRRWEGASSYL